MRAWLVGTSLVLHIGVIFGLFVAGMWRIDQLDPAKHRVDIGLAPPPPPAASGSPTPKAQPFTPKHHITHDVVQPVQHVTVATSEIESEISGTGSGTGSGSGSDPDSDGPCTENCGPGSAAALPVVVQAPPPPMMVAPTLLRGLRISGETQVQASNSIKAQLLNEGRSELTGMFKVCIDARGSVSSIGQLRSTGFPAYDDQLAGAIRTWRYRPYAVNNVPIPVCGVVTFNYSMK
jgi:TonB family protein